MDTSGQIYFDNEENNPEDDKKRYEEYVERVKEQEKQERKPETDEVKYSEGGLITKDEWKQFMGMHPPDGEE